MKIVKYIYKSIILILVCGLALTIKHTGITIASKVSNVSINKNPDLNAMDKVVEEFANADINFPLDTIYGYLTGYVANCPLCTGYLYCNNQNVLDGTVTFQDKTYGEVRIVASSKNLPCGSIVRFKNTTMTENGIMTAIVLDRGVTGNSLDLLVDSEETAITKVGNDKIYYDVLRYGWSR